MKIPSAGNCNLRRLALMAALALPAAPKNPQLYSAKTSSQTIHDDTLDDDGEDTAEYARLSPAEEPACLQKFAAKKTDVRSHEENNNITASQWTARAW